MPAEESRPEFASFVAQLKEQALAAGVSMATADAALANLEPLEIVVERDRSQAEVGADHRSVRLPPLDAILYSHRHRQATRASCSLAAIAKKYGVSSSVLVAIWGMESNFGRFTGSRPTVQALATLAWEGRRRAFFTTESSTRCRSSTRATSSSIR